MAGGGSDLSCFLGPLVSEGGDLWKQEASSSWNFLLVLEVPPDHSGPDSGFTVCLLDSSERNQGAYLMERHPVSIVVHLWLTGNSLY